MWSAQDSGEEGFFPFNEQFSPSDKLASGTWTWYNVTQKYFLGGSEYRPIFLKESLYDAPCSVPEYQKYSPIACLETIDNGENATRYKELMGIIRAWYSKWGSYNNKTEAEAFERNTCYREGEYLECVEGKCRCPQSGIFTKFRYQKGQYADRWTGLLISKTVTCVSPYGAYCIRNSRSCLGSGRCVTYGADRPWPWTCVTGVCRDNSADSGAKSSFLGYSGEVGTVASASLLVISYTVVIIPVIIMLIYQVV